jgi:hypothetical protein
MLKERLKFIAAAAFGAGAVLFGTGTGAHLVALHSSGSTLHAERTQVSPMPEASPTPEASPSPDAVAPAAPAVTPDDETAETVEDADDATEATEPAEAADVTETGDVNDDKSAAVTVAQPVAKAATEHEGADHSSDGKGD